MGVWKIVCYCVDHNFLESVSRIEGRVENSLIYPLGNDGD